MSDRADALDRLAGRLVVEARGLDGVADTIEPLVARVINAWEGPAADRLVSELGVEMTGLAAEMRSMAESRREEARRIRAAEAAALETAALDAAQLAAAPAVL